MLDSKSTMTSIRTPYTRHQTIERDKARGQELVDDLTGLKSNVDLFYSDWESVASTLNSNKQSDQDIPKRANKVRTALNA